MANALYDKGREAYAGGLIDTDTDTIKAIAVDSTYSINLATHDFFDDVTSGARVSAATTLSGVTITDGVIDCNDFVLGTLTSGKTIVRIIIYKDTGTESTSRLIAAIDTSSTGAISIGTTGITQVNVTVDNGANKLFKL